jgi:hypothetical protein
MSSFASRDEFPFCITLRSSPRIVFHAARRDDFLVGQAIRLSPPGVAAIVAARLLGGAGNLACSRLSGGAFVGHLCKLSADFIGALRSAQLSRKKPLGKPPSRIAILPRTGINSEAPGDQ